MRRYVIMLIPPSSISQSPSFYFYESDFITIINYLGQSNFIKKGGLFVPRFRNSVAWRWYQLGSVMASLGTEYQTVISCYQLV